MSVLSDLGLQPLSSGVCGRRFAEAPSGELITSVNPATGEALGSVRGASRADYDRVVDESAEAYKTWRTWPAPRRGEVIRQLGDALRRHQHELGALVSLEVGKIRAEGEGEVQEMIDICTFAAGLSRQLYGLSMHSERPLHRMVEQWHPLGPVGVISAFNFPVAVWSWNAALAAVCGDSTIWKPSELTPLCAVAVQRICNEITEKNGCAGIFSLIVGGPAIGAALSSDPRVPLVSATGSCRMGRSVSEAVARRFGRSILELGGNNAITVLADADLSLATRAILFGAVGTAGQRCTATRRVLVERSIAPALVDRLVKSYGQVKIGDPLAEGTLMGPLIRARAVDQMMAALEEAKAEGGEILIGGQRIDRPGFFVEPTIVRAKKDMTIVKQETFAPILYVIEVEGLDEAIAIQNDVPQGLSSSIFTRDLLSAERFLSATGSDCGIANVNLGTSGAEIGGAFGGEKETGGGREAGSDSWKQYMRRQTNTINWSRELPLAQGIRFGD
ncbi:MAG: aldehyde dehydrogenase family protein [Deltaproteobacteria bacterium]|nr:aldehyde dehydrogenase family protein [Deltaproteobacteria bacterium]